MFMPERARSAPEYAIFVRGLTKRFGRRVAIDDSGRFLVRGSVEGKCVAAASCYGLRERNVCVDFNCSGGEENYQAGR